MPQHARAVCLFVLMTSGCVDTAARFDEFNERLDEKRRRLEEEQQNEDAGPNDDCQPPTSEQLEGRYLFGVAVSIEPTKPIVASMVLSKVAGRPTKMLATYEVLSTDEARGPTGKFAEAEVTLDGNTVVIAKASIVVLGAGNPLQPGLDAEAAITSEAKVCAKEGEPVTFLCGETNGEITQPLTISVNGSKFGAVRVNEGDPWPSVISSCEEGTKAL